MRLTVVLPTLNEAEGVERTIRRIPREALRAQGLFVDVLVIDGASTDGTAQRARAAGAKVIVEPRKGYGRAYKTGLPATKSEWVVTSDADDTYPIDALPDLLAAVRARNLDFATVNRFPGMGQGSMSAKHRFGNRVLTTTARTLFGVKIHDSQSGMWILNRRAVAALPLERLSDGMPFSQEIKIAAFRHPDLEAAELAGRYYPRVGEAKLSSWRDGSRNLWALVRRRFGGLG